jgi:hypothetical protein
MIRQFLSETLAKVHPNWVLMMLEAEQNSNCLLEIFSSAALEKLLKHTNISLEYLREEGGERCSTVYWNFRVCTQNTPGMFANRLRRRWWSGARLVSCVTFRQFFDRIKIKRRDSTTSRNLNKRHVTYGQRPTLELLIGKGVIIDLNHVFELFCLFPSRSRLHSASVFAV